MPQAPLALLPHLVDHPTDVAWQSFGHRQGKTAACNPMIFGLVALMALETEATHMDVTAAGVEIEKGIQSAVFNRIFATA